MGIIFDIIIVVFFLISIFAGYKRGLIDALVKLASFAIAVILAFVLCAPVGNYITQNTRN